MQKYVSTQITPFLWALTGGSGSGTSSKTKKFLLYWNIDTFVPRYSLSWCEGREFEEEMWRSCQNFLCQCKKYLSTLGIDESNEISFYVRHGWIKHWLWIKYYSIVLRKEQILMTGWNVSRYRTWSESSRKRDIYRVYLAIPDS